MKDELSVFAARHLLPSFFRVDSSYSKTGCLAFHILGDTTEAVVSQKVIRSSLLSLRHPAMDPVKVYTFIVLPAQGSSDKFQFWQPRFLKSYKDTLDVLTMSNISQWKVCGCIVFFTPSEIGAGFTICRATKHVPR